MVHSNYEMPRLVHLERSWATNISVLITIYYIYNRLATFKNAGPRSAVGRAPDS